MTSKQPDNTFIVVAILLLLVSIIFFSNDYVTVDPIDGTVYLVQSKWWGLSQQYREIFWTQADGYDSPAWMTRAEDGTLYPAIVEDPRD